MGGIVNETKEICSNFIENLSIDLTENSLEISGVLHFYSHLDNASQTFFPFSKEKSNKNYIRDAYTIEVKLKKGYLPQVIETGGRLKEYSIANGGIPLIDLHYPKEIACLGSPDELNEFTLDKINSSAILGLFRLHVIPFFYAQSFYRMHKDWPWPNLEHGIVGLLEQFGKKHTEILFRILLRRINPKKYEVNSLEFRRVTSIVDKLRAYKIRGHRPCICRSGRKLRSCHPDAYEGLQKLQIIFNSNPKLKKY